MAKYLKNELTAEEETLFQKHLQERPDFHTLLESFRDTSTVQQEIDFISELDVDQAWQNVRLKKKKPLIKPLLKWLTAAAAMVLIAFSVLWPRWTTPDHGIVPDVSGKYKNDVLPGGHKAQLLLSNGQVIALDNGAQQLKEENGTTIIGERGELRYSATHPATNGPVLYNTLTVPRAGTYRLTLPDGSKVWLNALSEIRFPVQFASYERKVFLKGEAYFEISKDVTRPFKVAVNESAVEVLGTHFNISAYDTKTATTLLEGRVKVSSGKQQSILKPGQVASIIDRQINIHPADIQKAVAWKEEIFYFDKDGMDYIMEQLARWYDLKITYENELPTEKFSGSIKRNARLSEVLEMLNFISGATFEIEGRKLNVKY